MKIYSDEKILKIVSAKGKFFVLRLITLILILLSIFILFKNISNEYKILVSIIIILFVINYSLQTKRSLKKIRGRITTDDVLKNGKTGDIILLKPNTSNDLSEFVIFKMIPTNLTGDIWSDIGIIEKDENTNEIFVWICDEKNRKDHFTKKTKTGVKKLLFLDIVKKFDGIVSYSSIKKKIENKELVSKIKQYSKFPFMNVKSILGNPNIERGIGSCKFISLVFKDLDISVKKSIISHPTSFLGINHEPLSILAK